ncbi:MAG TPA: hypothetical protein VGU73_04380 [Acidimicrobiia bacterium]|nr:hypothetical protein [Acidimicrobiia bacterium]
MKRAWRRAARAVGGALFAVGLLTGGGLAGATGAPGVLRWATFRHVTQVVDLTARRADGSIVVAADGSLSLLHPDGTVTRFARGPQGYSTARGPEPYLTITTAQPVGGTTCTFPTDGIDAIQPGAHPAVIAVDPSGRARRLAELPPGVAPNGIAYDTVGSFGHRLLVTAATNHTTELFAIDCTGRATPITTTAPTVEGGMIVAPSAFGPFGGDLIAPDENRGLVWALDPGGAAHLVVDSGLRHGGDIGVESAGFVPPGFAADWVAYLADRVSPGNPHPGTDHILRLTGAALLATGVRAGDLLVASEGGAATITVRCTPTCRARHVADGPPVSHGEGHLVVVPPR